MAIQERIIDLTRIHEPDLIDSPGSTHSGWHLTRDEKIGEDVYQMMVRPDNFRALDYFDELGHQVGKNLINNGRSFLLPVELFKPANQRSAIVLPPTIEQFLKNL